MSGSGEQRRILEMLAAGQISTDDAARLLEALRKPRPALHQWLFLPMDVLQTKTALALSAAVALAQLAVSRLDIRFDGALDVHVVEGPVTWGQALLDLVLAWPIVALLFWGLSQLVARQGRFVDFVAAVGVARVPIVAAGLMAGLFRGAFLGGEPSAALVVVAVLTLPLVAWFATLLVTGMRTASGLRGWRLGLTAAGAILVAEVVTKLLLLLAR